MTTKNGLALKIFTPVAAAVILAVLAFLYGANGRIESNAHAGDMNKIEVKRVDKKVDVLIMEQKAFREDTTEKLHAIDKGVLRIEERLKARDP